MAQIITPDEDSASHSAGRVTAKISCSKAQTVRVSLVKLIAFDPNGMGRSGVVSRLTNVRTCAPPIRRSRALRGPDGQTFASALQSLSINLHVIFDSGLSVLFKPNQNGFPTGGRTGRTSAITRHHPRQSLRYRIQRGPWGTPAPRMPRRKNKLSPAARTHVQTGRGADRASGCIRT